MMNEHNEAQGGGMMMGGGRIWHWACCILPVATLLMWIAAVVFVVLSWITVLNQSGSVWGYGPQWWIWNAVMFGILAMYGSRRKIGCHCGVCMHGTGMQHVAGKEM